MRAGTRVAEKTCVLCGRTGKQGFFPAPGESGVMCNDDAACRDRRGLPCDAANPGMKDEFCRRGQPHFGQHVGFFHAWTDELL